MRLNFHALHVLKAATPKLRKAIVSNCDRELVHSICECGLNELNGNVRLSDCVALKLRKHRTVLRKGGRQATPPVGQKEAHSAARRVPAAPTERSATRASHSHFQAVMLLKMYLVPADQLNKQTETPCLEVYPYYEAETS